MHVVKSTLLEGTGAQAETPGRWHEARRSSHLEAYCQRPTGLTDELCWRATVPDISSDGLRLVVDRRFEAGTVLAVDLIDKERCRQYPTKLVRVKEVTAQTGSEWSIECTFLDAPPAAEPDDALPVPWRTEPSRAPLTAPCSLQMRRRSPLPRFPVRQVLVQSAGWAVFLVMLLYLANARREPSEPNIWRLDIGLGVAALGVLLVVFSACVEWLNKLIASRMGQLHLTLWARTVCACLVPRRPQELATRNG